MNHATDSRKYGMLENVKTTLEIPDPIFRKAKAKNIHSAYFDVSRTQDLIVSILRGVDRSVLKQAFSELV